MATANTNAHANQAESTPATLLAEVFASRIRAAVLGWIVPRQETPFSLTELSQALTVPISSLQHECYKLERIGVLTARREGASKRYRFHLEHRLARPLVGLVIAALGLETVLAETMNDLGEIAFATLASPLGPGEPVLLAIQGDAGLEELDRAVQRVALVLGRPPESIELAYFRDPDHPLDTDHPLARRLAGRSLQPIIGHWPISE